MLNELIHRLQGQVWIRAESAFPERVLNLCGARDLAFWDLSWESPTAFTCRLSRRDWHTLRRAAANLECTLSVVGREGAPYFLIRFRRRQVLLAGLALCAAGLFFGSFFVWDFRIEGNETVPTERILRALEQNGVHLGSFGLSLDGEDIRNHVLLEIPELSWLTVNVSGCRANVQVRERVFPPERMDDQTPTNVVARRSGMVLKVQALDGVAEVLKGSTVTQGQLLISGVEDTDTFGARILAGMGSVTARTWYTLETPLPPNAMVRQATGETKTRISLVFGTHRVKFYANSSVETGNYDKITNRYPLHLLGLSLPITLVTETWYAYERVPADSAAVQASMGTVLTEYLHSLVDPYGTVKSTLFTVRTREGMAVLTAECEEEIGQQVPIFTEEQPGA